MQMAFRFGHRIAAPARSAKLGRRRTDAAVGAATRTIGSSRSFRALGVFPSPLWFSGWCFPEMEVDCWRFYAELGDLVIGRRRGRSGADEITIFDSSGTGVQDVAAAARAFELARERGIGSRFQLA